MSTDIRKYAYIDLLRGLAVLGVIATHVRAEFAADASQYLQMGVQLFFVASALTLCLSMRSRGGGKYHLLAYALRRFFRIAPLFYVAIAVYFFLGDSIMRNHYDALNVAGNLLFLHGLFPFIYAAIVAGGWSIGTEVLFYLTFPALFVVLNSLQSSLIAATVYLGGLAYIVLLTRLGYLGNFHVPNNQFLYFNLLVQMPVFLCGIAAYHVIQQKHAGPPAWLVATAGGAGLLLGVFMWNSTLAAKFLVVPGGFGIGFAALAILLSRQGDRAMSVPPARMLQEIGRKSYAIYLFHFPFAWGLWPKWFHPASLPLPSPVVLLLGLIFVLVPSYAIALVAGRLIEEPGIALGKRLVDKLQKPAPAPALAFTR